MAVDLLKVFTTNSIPSHSIPYHSISYHIITKHAKYILAHTIPFHPTPHLPALVSSAVEGKILSDPTVHLVQGHFSPAIFSIIIIIVAIIIIIVIQPYIFKVIFHLQYYKEVTLNYIYLPTWSMRHQKNFFHAVCTLWKQLQDI